MSEGFWETGGMRRGAAEGKGDGEKRGDDARGELNGGKNKHGSRVRIHFSRRRFRLLSGSFCFVAGNKGNSWQAAAIFIFMQFVVYMVTDIGAVGSYPGLS